MKPLEPGCRAIVIRDSKNPENVGKEVILGVSISPGNILRVVVNENGSENVAEVISGREGWMVNGTVRSYVEFHWGLVGGSFKGLAESFLDSKGIYFNAVFRPHQLMRIDGFSDEDKQKDREQEIGRGILTSVVWAGDQYSNVE